MTTFRVRLPKDSRDELFSMSKEAAGNGGYRKFLVGILEKAIDDGYQPPLVTETRLEMDGVLKEKIREAAKSAGTSPEVYVLTLFEDVTHGRFKV